MRLPKPQAGPIHVIAINGTCPFGQQTLGGPCGVSSWSGHVLLCLVFWDGSLTGLSVFWLGTT